MDAMRLLGFIGIVMAAGVMMAFILDFLSTERSDARETCRVDIEPGVGSISQLPAFFARPQTSEHLPAHPVSDDALIAFLEAHVRAEHAMVTKFVHLPSLDALYRPAKSSPTLH